MRKGVGNEGIKIGQLMLYDYTWHYYTLKWGRYILPEKEDLRGFYRDFFQHHQPPISLFSPGVGDSPTNLFCTLETQAGPGAEPSGSFKLEVDLEFGAALWFEPEDSRLDPLFPSGLSGNFLMGVEGSPPADLLPIWVTRLSKWLGTWPSADSELSVAFKLESESQDLIKSLARFRSSVEEQVYDKDYLIDLAKKPRS